MKLNKIALAVIATAATAASAGVTVSPVLLGYHYHDEAHDDQRATLKTGINGIGSASGTNNTNAGVALESGLYTGAALGIELTPATQFQVEYGVTNTDARVSEASQNAGNRFDAEQETISGNFLVGFDQFTGYNDNRFKPYALIGAGQAKYDVEVDQLSSAAAPQVTPGTTVATSKDTIGNVGLGARYLVNDALALRGELRAVHNFDNKWWEGLAMAGLEVTLGGRLAPAVPVPPPADPVETVEVAPPVVLEETVVDSDMDGVPDHLDECQGTPRNVVVDERGCARKVDIRDDLRLELRVFFDYDKSVIKPQYRQEVARVAEAMREFPNATAAIEGHASKDRARSSATYNQRLSEARANAVKSMLTNEFGIAPNRLSAVGYGFDRPIAPNTTEEGRAQNRRVYAVITGDKTVTVDQTVDMQVR